MSNISSIEIVWNNRKVTKINSYIKKESTSIIQNPIVYKDLWYVFQIIFWDISSILLTI